MTPLDMIRTMFEYNDALNRRLWDSIMTLSDEQFVQEVGYSRGSVRDQAIHLASAEGGWMRGLQGDANARQYRLDPADHPTPAAGRAAWEKTAGELLAYVSGLSQIELEETPPGLPVPRWQALLHLANHGTDHRSQMLRILADFGAPTFEQDLLFHVWRR
ncbi:MAG TPA: DinB family protein [Anaerolineae bacterium]|jgi:uncharacterized damage-inducible protein DinB|nr:DinB family protein [Anaerolineae bacterium]